MGSLSLQYSLRALLGRPTSFVGDFEGDDIHMARAGSIRFRDLRKFMLGFHFRFGLGERHIEPDEASTLAKSLLTLGNVLSLSRKLQPLDLGYSRSCTYL